MADNLTLPLAAAHSLTHAYGLLESCCLLPIGRLLHGCTLPICGDLLRLLIVRSIILLHLRIVLGGCSSRLTRTLDRRPLLTRGLIHASFHGVATQYEEYERSHNSRKKICASIQYTGTTPPADTLTKFVN
jgi:hypothetical protein